MSSPWGQKSLDHLKGARESLDNARRQLGNDHPAYPRLVALIEETYAVENLYPTR